MRQGKKERKKERLEKLGAVERNKRIARRVMSNKAQMSVIMEEHKYHNHSRYGMKDLPELGLCASNAWAKVTIERRSETKNRFSNI
jgi:hypothetical protein